MILFHMLKRGVKPGSGWFTDVIRMEKGLLRQEKLCSGEVVAMVVSAKGTDRRRQLLPVMRCEGRGV